MPDSFFHSEVTSYCTDLHDFLLNPTRSASVPARICTCVIFCALVISLIFLSEKRLSASVPGFTFLAFSTQVHSQDTKTFSDHDPIFMTVLSLQCEI